MGKISVSNIHSAYDAARKVHAGKIAERDAIDDLVHTYSMNAASAAIYIRALKVLLEGSALKRGMSALSFAIYLDRITEDYGAAAARKAVDVVRAHIEYYNALGRGNLNQVSAICDAAVAQLA